MVYESSTDQASVRWRVIDVSSADVLSEGDLNLNPYAFVASPDGSTVAAAGATGEIVTIDVSAGDQRRSSTSLGAEVRWLNYSDDGELLVSGAADGGVSLWDATTLTARHRVPAPTTARRSRPGAVHRRHPRRGDRVVRRPRLPLGTDVERAINFACQWPGGV
jgi:WD40 repeat protein